ncbi:MAG: geranylgeranyl pyrophosphate synthase [Ignavibacteriae bacterium]|nr:MAG: geranylgeranyl pyrophosphate synthase [Ignavibacteriota bacterium]
MSKKFNPKNYYKKVISNFEKKYQLILKNKEPKSLYEPCDFIVESTGKRLRPFLVLISAQAVGAKLTKVQNAAMAVELFHNFTLVHDDIMDNADKRRGRPTLHIKYDINTAILAGDNLLAIAYQRLLMDCKKNNIIPVEDFTQGLIEVCEGQSLDKEFETRKDVTLEEYIVMINKKTAALAETCCSIGAKIGGGSVKEINALRKYGKYLGFAFQIQDDLLDIMADEAELGKKIGGDLLEGKKTYLLLKALEKSEGEDNNLVKKVIENNGIRKNQINKYKELYIKLDVIEEASKEVKRYTNLALNSLKNIQNSNAKETLIWLASSLTNRKK